MKRPFSTLQVFAGTAALALIFGLQSIASQVLVQPQAPVSPPRPTVAALPSNPSSSDRNSEQVTIQLSSDREEVSPGDLVTLSIEIQNKDKALKARGVEARLPMPAWLDLVSASATQGQLTLRNRTLKNHTGAIKPKKDAHVTVIARVNRKAAETEKLLTAITLVYREGSGITVTRLSPGPVFRRQ